MLFWKENLLNYTRNYRVLFVDGRYGGGKTSLGFKLAEELCRKFGFRYILSNVECVWNTPLDEVVLRDGRYIDAVFVLDEGGMYLETSAVARQWLAYLRKLNIVLIVPSVIPPSSIMQRLTVQRLLNMYVFGVPVWYYGLYLRSGRNKSDDKFGWLHPSEIFGIYDTEGMPQEASEQLAQLQKWTKEVQKVMGYASRGLSIEDATLAAVNDIMPGQPSAAASLTIVDEISPEMAWAATNDQMSEVIAVTEMQRMEMEDLVMKLDKMRRRR